jgi:hypothetical protein
LHNQFTKPKAKLKAELEADALLEALNTLLEAEEVKRKKNHK